MNPEPKSQSELKSKVILVVESEFLVASFLTEILKDVRCIVVPVSRVADGLHMIYALDGQIDAAILDIRRASQQSYSIAGELSKRGVPFLFATTYRRQNIAPQFADRPYLSKPYTITNLLLVLSGIVKRR
jgi:CheY-like chemotaxis protein